MGNEDLIFKMINQNHFPNLNCTNERYYYSTILVPCHTKTVMSHSMEYRVFYSCPGFNYDNGWMFTNV